VGLYDILLGTGTQASNYAITFNTDNDAFNITQRAITLAAAAATKVYGDSDAALSVSLKAGTLGQVTVSDSLADVTGVLSREVGENVGVYDIALGTGTQASNYAITFNTDNDAFDIKAKPITVTADALNKVYGDLDPSLSFATDVSLVSGDSFSGALSRAVGEDVAAYAIGQNTLSIADGNSGKNYALSYVGDDLTITQRDSVTWVGSFGANWSEAINWEDSALPVRNNVANVLIPQGTAVLYDSERVGQTGSVITNNGTIRFASNNPFTLVNTVQGVGNLEQRGMGLLTLIGANRFSGTTDIANYAVTVASSNGLGMGNVASNGGLLTVANDIVLDQLSVSGPVVLQSNMISSGSQVYQGMVTFTTGSLQNPMTIRSNNGSLTFDGSISAGQGSKPAQRSLTLQGNQVTVGDQIGLPVKNMSFGELQGTEDVNPYALRIVGNEIYLLADITTFESQRYEGSVFIGDNGSNGSTRTLVSVDPSVTFTGTIDAVIAGLHSLDVRAYTLALSLMEAPEINFGRSVGQTRALATLFADVDLQNRSPNALVATPAPNRQPTIGQVTLGGNVTTTGSQTYRGSSVMLGAVGQTITLTANSGTIDIITRTGFGSGASGLDRLQLRIGDSVKLNTNLVGLLRSENVDLNQLLTGRQSELNSPYLSRQDQAGEFVVDVKTQNIESTLMLGEVVVGEVTTVECVQVDSAAKTDCTASGS
jgi:hypothetical protein